jgi:signal transduction histidine kinase
MADRKQIRLIEDLGEDMPPLQADEFYLERLVYNLIINALHWTPVNGQVSLKTGNRPLGSRSYLFLEVADSGPGVPAEQKKHLFDKTRTPRGKRDLMSFHSGLGLYIAQSVARAHGGSLSEEGRPGEGARFVCLLPASEEAA